MLAHQNKLTGNTCAGQNVSADFYIAAVGLSCLSSHLQLFREEKHAEPLVTVHRGCRGALAAFVSVYVCLCMYVHSIV